MEGALSISERYDQRKYDYLGKCEQNVGFEAWGTLLGKGLGALQLEKHITYFEIE